MPHELPKTYDPAAIEEKWAERWVQQDLWRQPGVPSSDAKKQEPFTMLLPPPNVTGRLHMGHMLNQTEMDILARWHRMRGDRTLWVPGTDHAGIATQMMVERQLGGEGTSRQALGRAVFTDRVWQWRAEYGGAILGQMKRLGASVDWAREYFTMDDNLSLAVREAFVRLHEQGLIYRGKYIVNWDPVQQTAVSDLEVTHEERMGKLYHVRYPLADGTGSVTIATTRPETMLGDVAVAVNPSDARYKALVGRMLRLPLMDREIPVIADDWANPEFGTGAVKVTPAHDPNDFAIGTRHNLPQLTIMDADARIDLPGSPYHRLDRYAARERIVEDLRTAGLLVEVKDHAMAIGLSQRTGAVIEPRLSTQWFLRTADFTNEAGEKCEGLARKAIEAVERGHITFTPEQYRKTYMQWMENIHDWCISRQLWWGHRIPAWHCAACAKDTVARATPAACPHCGSAEIEQDADVLDTWFSSGLLPFTVFGWPENTAELESFYPTSLLVTGSDILFFWVARMVMFGCWFMGDDPNGPKLPLAKSVPFKEVYIHALVRDAERQKMSKTKGNVLDPIQVVNQYGTDAVRFTLASMASPGTDIAFNEQRTEGYRAFANKIWNAARFIFMNVERAKDAGVVVDMPALAEAEQSAEIEARWIRAQLAATAGGVAKELAEYRFDNAANLIYQFFWGDLCDWYLEIVKLRLVFNADGENAGATAALHTLLGVFEASLRLLSPFMPFLTEELWQALHDGQPPQVSVALAPYPTDEQPFAYEFGVLGEMALLQELATAVRALRKDLAMPEKQPAEIVVHAGVAFDASAHALVLQKLAFASAVSGGAFDPALARRTTANFEVQVLFVRTIDPEAEAARLNKEIAGLRKGIEAAERQLGNAGFLSKAPANVVDGLKAQHTENASLLAKKQSELDMLVSAE
jgi:valyl-tRNA synthetase